MGIIEIGIGARIFVSVDNVKFGAWWVGVIMVITSCIISRRYSRRAAAVISSIVALIGAIVDGEGTIITIALHSLPVNPLSFLLRKYSNFRYITISDPFLPHPMT